MKNNYSLLDKLLHKFSFATTKIQVDMTDLENKLFAKTLGQAHAEQPVFIAGLPRSGSTLLLELLNKQGEFATHHYRDMPFVLLPLIWDRISKNFRKKSVKQLRAHNDGMEVDYDSPEAFEEMIWKAFWQDNYRDTHIVPWELNQQAEFNFYFTSHMKKISHLRQGRYISKNNGNIARIPWLLEHCPSAQIIIPFRAPLQQAKSLLGQHLNFLDIHQQDPFAKKYMAAIGHFDFGCNLKPINFNDWLKDSDDPKTLDFWLQYWIAAYGQLATINSDRVMFICYEQLCREPEIILQQISDFLALANPERLIAQKQQIKNPSDALVEESTLLSRANDLYGTLLSLS